MRLDLWRGGIAAALMLFSISVPATDAEMVSGKTRIVMLKGHGYAHHARHQPEMRAPEVKEAFHASLTARHDRVLKETVGREAAGKKLYDYHHLVPGFAAVLTDKEVEAMREHDDVWKVEDEMMFTPHTTHTYRFLGLDNTRKGLYKKANGTDVIIGVLDTGVWPEGPSFFDEGFGPPPEKWNGICQAGQNWTAANCNNKVIGARWFVKGYATRYGYDPTSLPAASNEYLSPRDGIGHGSYMASIAAGAKVRAAVVDGFNLGKPQGMAFAARLAIYKVCWLHDEGGLAKRVTYCGSSDITAAMNIAIGDGVDILSISLGSGPSLPGDDFINHMAYSAFYANLNNIPTIFSAGNDGASGSYTVANAAPWQFTVAATTTDRIFQNYVVLPDGQTFRGAALMNNGTQGKFYPLIKAEDAALPGVLPFRRSLCLQDTLNETLVAGKIVLCKRGVFTLDLKGANVLKAGGAGMIAYNTEDYGEALSDYVHYLPASAVGYQAGLALLEYVSSSTPTASLTRSEEVYGPAVKEAPFMYGSSSTGPAASSFYVLKPDIAAPGNQIVGAWSASPLTAESYTTSWLPSGNPAVFNFLEGAGGGTSLATPHVSGVIALLKSIHPDWPPSYFYSAITTTGVLTTNRKRAIPLPDAVASSPTGPTSGPTAGSNPFNFGGGFLNANAAGDPGLVYGISAAGYDTFLCSPDGGFERPATQLGDGNCANGETRAVDLNLPSISFYGLVNTTKTRRTVTNVGKQGTYTVFVKNAAGGYMTVSPKILTFSAVGESQSYTIRMKPDKPTSVVKTKVTTSPATIEGKPSYQQVQAWTFGSITWSDRSGHKVRINVALNIP